jgi:DNA-damage-inducible protein D
MIKNELAIFEDYQIRRKYYEKSETCYFSIVYIIRILLQQQEHQTARKYWNNLKGRLISERSESVTICHQFKIGIFRKPTTNKKLRGK